MCLTELNPFFNMKYKKLHIVFLDFDDIKNPLLGAGQAKATVEVGSRLVKKGHKVTVICSRYPGYKDRKENGLYYKHIGMGTRNIKLNNMLYILLLPFTVMRLKADIIVECFTAPISTLFSPVFTKIPVVGLPTSFEADRFSKLYHLPFEKIENFGLSFYTYFLPYTKHFEEKIKKSNKKAITKIVPEGVGNEFFKIKKTNPKHILYLGRLDMGQKGLDLLIHAYAKINKQTKYPLVIAGYGPDEKRLKNLVRKLRLEKRVLFVGPTYGDFKNKLLSEALFVAFPSRHEGFSLFSLEALASGNPMVSFDIPSLSWTDEKTVWKAKPFNVSEYSQLLKKLSKNYKTIHYMSKNARKIARKYTWENVANEFESFFLTIKTQYEN